MTDHIAEVIVNGPFQQSLDYRIPKGQPISIGARVIVPLRNRKTVGFIIGIKKSSNFNPKQLKTIIQTLDEQPILDDHDISLLKWLSTYYHSTYYETLQSMLPNLILKGLPLLSKTTHWQIIPSTKPLEMLFLKNATKQLKAYKLLSLTPEGLSIKALQAQKISTQTLNQLKQKGLVSSSEIAESISLPQNNTKKVIPNYTLNDAQLHAINQIKQSLNHYQTFLLDGVTGSGKTEVYLNIISSILENKQQALILVPEIGLTNQLVQRFESRFDTPIITFHSHLNDKMRLNAWHLVKSNQAKIVIGTRSAVFLPFQNLGAIFVDEEHDASYKQQNSLRYHGRDIAILRAKRFNIPIILGSATPSLESLYNAEQNKFTKLSLTYRAGNATSVRPYLIDMRHNAVHSGLSQQLIEQMHIHLDRGNQVLLFLNRRGYAPTLICQSCGTICQCNRCDAPYTYHINPNRLICHFCETQSPIITNCSHCNYSELTLLGQGTERIEEYLSQKFPSHHIVRIDRSATGTQNTLNASFETITSNKAQIIIGTQMLAKGHHFPNVTLVGILNIDAGLYSQDFRALERTGQLITQVAGRAGRDYKKGQMYLQTHTPEHPLLNCLLNDGYAVFAKKLQQERQAALWPPYSALTLIKGESTCQNTLEAQMQTLKSNAEGFCENGQLLIGPFPALRYKKQDKFRMMLVLQAPNKLLMQHALTQIHHTLIIQSNSHKVRYIIDVDPNELMS